MPRLLDKEDKLFVDYIDENAPKIAISTPRARDEALPSSQSREVDKIVYVLQTSRNTRSWYRLLGVNLGYGVRGG